MSYDYDVAWRRWGAWQDHAPTALHLRRLILRRAADLSFGSVLDVGTGLGHLVAAFRRRFPSCRAEGCDISGVAVERAARRHPEIAFHRLDIESQILEKRFDLLVLSEVLEHLEAPEAALANLRRMCAGQLILTTPTGPVLPTDAAFGHLRHPSPAELASQLSATGWSVVRLERWGWPFQTLLRHLINLAPGASYEAFGAAGSYGPLRRLAGRLWVALFYLNRHGAGTQLIAVAAPDGTRTGRGTSL